MASSRSAASRDRRALWGAIGVSLAWHLLGFAALALAVGAGGRSAGVAAAGARGGGGGVVFVELVPGEAEDAGAPDAVVEEPRTRDETPPAPIVARRRVAAAAARTVAPVAPFARPEVRAARPVALAEASETPETPPSPSDAATRASDAPAGEASTPTRRAAAPRASASPGAGSSPGAAGERGSGGSGAATGGALERVARPAAPLRPRYPEGARERGEEASVVVEAWVTPRGRVERALVRSSAGAEFDDAALEAVRAARFHPARRDGAPVASRVAMRLHFALER